MDYILTIFAFFLGTAIGSFLNVVAIRLPKRRKFLQLQQRSKCPKCRHVLHTPDLVPIVSYLFLRGRCRYCRKPISPQYVLLELITGATFALLVWQYGVSGTTLVGLVGASFLIALGTIDARLKIVPDALSLPAIASVFLVQVLVISQFGAHGFSSAMFRSLGGLLLGAAIGALWFWLQWLVSRGKWVGTGDIRLGALLGVFLGMPHTLLALFLAYITGSLWAGVLLARHKVRFGGSIPFGAFLAFAAIVIFIFGPAVVSWYQRVIGW
jgi:prepilin signal peptidase PulO-like enzyme (type II secretory pathway)